MIATKYSMEKAKKLTQEDLVAFTLFSKSDYFEGIPGIGEKTFMKLIDEMKNNQVQDILTR